MDWDVGIWGYGAMLKDHPPPRTHTHNWVKVAVTVNSKHLIKTYSGPSKSG